MIDWTSSTIAAVWTVLTLFVAENIEPLPGVWVAAVSGALLAAFTGDDKPIGRLFLHIVTGVLVGVFASQLLAEIITLKSPLARVAEAFFCAMFAEKIIAGVHNGTIVHSLRHILQALLGGRK